MLSGGYTILPNVLFRAYHELGMSEGELVLVLQLCTYWWGRQAPFPSVTTLAGRMGKTPRQIQHYLGQLREKNLLRVEARRGADGRQLSNAYDLAPLLALLAEHSPGAEQVPHDEGSPPSRVTREPVPVQQTTGEGVNQAAPEEHPLEKYHGSKSDPIPPTPAQPAIEHGDDTSVPLASPIGEAVARASAQLGDDSVASSVARAERLLVGSGLTDAHFLALLAEARDRTCARQATLVARTPGGRARGMPYFFAVVEASLAAAAAPPTQQSASGARASAGDRHRPARIPRVRLAGVDAPPGPPIRMDVVDDPLWQAVLTNLRETLAPPVYTRISAMRAGADAGGGLLVEVEDEFQGHWLMRTLRDRIEDALRALGHDEPRIRTRLAAA